MVEETAPCQEYGDCWAHSPGVWHTLQRGLSLLEGWEGRDHGEGPDHCGAVHGVEANGLNESLYIHRYFFFYYVDYQIDFIVALESTMTLSSTCMACDGWCPVQIEKILMRH